MSPRKNLKLERLKRNSMLFLKILFTVGMFWIVAELFYSIWLCRLYQLKDMSREVKSQEYKLGFSKEVITTLDLFSKCSALKSADAEALCPVSNIKVPNVSIYDIRFLRLLGGVIAYFTGNIEWQDGFDWGKLSWIGWFANFVNPPQVVHPNPNGAEQTAMQILGHEYEEFRDIEPITFKTMVNRLGKRQDKEEIFLLGNSKNVHTCRLALESSLPTNPYFVSSTHRSQLEEALSKLHAPKSHPYYKYIQHVETKAANLRDEAKSHGTLDKVIEPGAVVYVALDEAAPLPGVVSSVTDSGAFSVVTGYLPLNPKYAMNGVVRISVYASPDGQRKSVLAVTEPQSSAQFSDRASFSICLVHLLLLPAPNIGQKR